MKQPDSPSVSLSEPEKEQRIVDAALEAAKEPERTTVVSLQYALDFLQDSGLDVDDAGFIIDSENGEFVEPYAFDRSAFQEIESPVDNPFESYYRPETEVDGVLIGAKSRLHLSDLHSLYTFEGETHPIKDDKLNLTSMARHTGLTFKVVCEWSDALDFATQGDAGIVHMGLESSSELSLSCIDCGYVGVVGEWDEDDGGDIRCPECSCLWDEYSLEVCTSCDATTRWEDLDHSGGKYWEPYCPECRADANNLDSQTRYNQ